ncbi:MAG: aldo/keto reductase [Gemmatimonadales bacterium]|jgi:aryl-alcohol dehydrogenase-like predicted oxidoreductase|nr:aldo/keto reductase [Gemmatimonadales bacterium]
MTPQDYSRREFVKLGAVGTASAMLYRGHPLAPQPPMPERPLGRTGHQVRLFSLGGQATLERDGTHDESIAIINRAIDLGVNYIDTAAAYGRGISQTYIGEVMATRRDEVFLATKTHDRTRDGSLRLLDESLRLLQTDHLDLWQLHNISRDNDIERIFAPGGAIEALTKARDEKIVRFLGITGHFDPSMLMDGIGRFDFDTVLMAMNPADPHHLPFRAELLPLANRKQMGVIAMKIPARGRLFRDGGVTSMQDAMRWVLTQPVSTVIVGCDTVAQLEENVRIAAGFEPMSEEEQQRVSALTAGYATEAAFFKRDAAGFGRGDRDDQDTD